MLSTFLLWWLQVWISLSLSFLEFVKLLGCLGLWFFSSGKFQQWFLWTLVIVVPFPLSSPSGTPIMCLQVPLVVSCFSEASWGCMFWQYWGLNSVLFLLGRCSTTWATLPALFWFSHFSDKVLHFYTRLASHPNLPTFFSPQVSTTTPGLLIEMGGGGLTNFLPSLALNCDSPNFCLPSN
jgi:hypothetical protein